MEGIEKPGKKKLNTLKEKIKQLLNSLLMLIINYFFYSLPVKLHLILIIVIITQR